MGEIAAATRSLEARGWACFLAKALEIADVIAQHRRGIQNIPYQTRAVGSPVSNHVVVTPINLT